MRLLLPLSVGICCSLQAATWVVDVTPALTNGTGWVAVGNVLTTVDGRICFRARDAAIVSPDVGFAVTTAVVTAFNTTEPETRRTLGIAPASSNGWDVSSAVVHAPVEVPDDYGASWSATARVSRIAAYCAGGERTSLYLTRIALYGEPFVAAPTGLTPVAADRSAWLHWQAEPRAVSNRATVVQIVTTPESWTNETHYGFDDCKASQAAFRDQAEWFCRLHPEFSGEMFGFRVDGQMQISTTDASGWLGYSGRERFDGVALRVRAKRPRPSDKPTMPVSSFRPDETNVLANVQLDYDYAEQTLSLSEVPDGAMLRLNFPCSTLTDQRVMIDDLWFYDGYSAAKTQTNVVAAVTVLGNKVNVAGLTPRSEYRAEVVSYDADGHGSPPTSCWFRTLPRQGCVLLSR